MMDKYYDCKGWIIKLKNVTVVPYELEDHGWICVIVKSNHPSYPVGGYNIFVPVDELRKGEVISL